MEAIDLIAGDVVINSQGIEMEVRYAPVARSDGKVILYFTGYRDPMLVRFSHQFNIKPRY